MLVLLALLLMGGILLSQIDGLYLNKDELKIGRAQQGGAKAGEERIIAGMKMVWIPAGKFMMGSPDDEAGRDSDEAPVHEVIFRHGFWMGQYEVTQKQWQNIMDSHPDVPEDILPVVQVSVDEIQALLDKLNKLPDIDNGSSLLDENNNPPAHQISVENIQGFLKKMSKRTVTSSHPSRFKGDDLPVEQVNWDIIQIFIHALNKQTGKQFRLPSEAEWEYATRAGTRGAFSFELPITTDKVNYDGSESYQGSPLGKYREGTVPVGSFKPNPWGLYQVHGNVWEWTQDCWHESYKNAPSDGSPWISDKCDKRVLRGGGWGNFPHNLRSAKRFAFRPDFIDSNFGFRVILESSE